jgi:hypothetical protein
MGDIKFSDLSMGLKIPIVTAWIITLLWIFTIFLVGFGFFKVS